MASVAVVVSDLMFHARIVDALRAIRAEPGSPPEYVAACFYTFDTVESFVAAFLPHAQELQGDMPRYTNITPEIQFNEIVISKPGAA